MTTASRGQAQLQKEIMESSLSKPDQTALLQFFAVQQALAALREESVDISPEARAGVGGHDFNWDSSEEFVEYIRRSLWFCTDTVMLEEFAHICYKRPEKRRFLLQLAQNDGTPRMVQ